LMTLLSVMAYHSFSGEVEASNTPTIRRLIPLGRHQLPRLALGALWVGLRWTFRPGLARACRRCDRFRRNYLDADLASVVRRRLPAGGVTFAFWACLEAAKR
jgi:hypothetical protein